MSDYWDYYLVQVNEKPASIAVDMGMRDVLPNPDLTRLHWVWISLQLPFDQGMAARAEGPTLRAIEKALTAECTLAGACYVGRVMTDGRLELYYYAPPANPIGSAIHLAMRGYPDYEYQVGDKDDRGWSHYHEFLYPDGDEQQTIENRKLIRRLENAGDLLDVPRTIRHRIVFPSANNRDGFARAAVGRGFVAERIPTHEAGGRHTLTVARVDSADPVEIDTVVLALHRMAVEFEGEYIGWESPVVRRDSTAKPGFFGRLFKRLFPG